MSLMPGADFIEHRRSVALTNEGVMGDLSNSDAS